MRVHEYAKKLKISSKELLEKLSSKGFTFSSHMSVLSDEAKNYLDKQQLKKTKVPVKKQSASSIDKCKKVEKNKKVSESKSKSQKKSTDLSKEKVITEKSIETANKLKVVAKEEVIKASQLLKDAPKEKTVTSKVTPVSRTYKSFSNKRFEQKRPYVKTSPKIITEIEAQDSMVLGDVAKLMGKYAGDLIFVLLKKGLVCNINSVIPIETIEMLGQEFNITVLAGDVKKELAGFDKKFERSGQGQTRWPIVVVMGHVDHGKTTLLDYLRKMNVAAKEKGGITQHLGAYEVDSVHGKMVFLDTPGHEAFSYMRQKGAKVTDIAILIVAADDGVKPQTIEAIKHARESGVPIIVAVNKIDKPGVKAGVETVKRQLAQHDLVTEDWGGQTICVPISAKTGQGVEELLEMITLQAEMMELKADSKIPARAFILESTMEKGYGPVATVIPVEGTLKQGDFFTCGDGTGRVRLLIDSFGAKITQAEPSIPVKIVGFDKFVSLGEWLQVVSRKEYLKAKSSVGSLNVRVQGQPFQNLTSVFSSETPDKFLNLIIKTDMHGSKEAVLGSLNKLSKQKKDKDYPIRIVSSGIGDISEGDILLAENTNAEIIGLHVKAERNALRLAKERSIDIKLYDVIYHMVEDIEKFLLTKKVIKKQWKKTAELTVRKVFNIKKAGVIAGCYVTDGVISRNNKVECIRGGKAIGEGKVVSLQREKKTVKEVHSGYECGFTTDRFHDWQVGDTVYCYEEVKEPVNES